LKNAVIDKNEILEKDIELLINKADIIIENTIKKINYEIILMYWQLGKMIYDYKKEHNSKYGDAVVVNSFDSYATSIRHDVASTTYLAFNAARNGETLITAMNNQRLSIAGVSLDEEMVHLIRYQHAYSGAARVITAMDDALDRLINGTGRVGL